MLNILLTVIGSVILFVGSHAISLTWVGEIVVLGVVGAIWFVIWRINYDLNRKITAYREYLDMLKEAGVEIND